MAAIREASAKLITEIDGKLKEIQQDKVVEVPEIEAESEVKKETGISFYVAECAEFHNLGEYHENLSLQEAVEIYNAIPSERIRGGKEIGCELITKLEGKQSSVAVGLFQENSIEMDTVHLLHLQENPLVKEAMRELLVAYPDANIMNRDAMANFAEDMRLTVRELYSDDEKMQEEITGELKESIGPHLTREDIENICTELEESIKRDPNAEDVDLAKTMLCKLDDIWLRKENNPLAKVEELEEQNYNQIDGALSNISPDDKLPKGSIHTKLEAAKNMVVQKQENHQANTNVKEQKEIGGMSYV